MSFEAHGCRFLLGTLGIGLFTDFLPSYLFFYTSCKTVRSMPVATRIFVADYTDQCVPYRYCAVFCLREGESIAYNVLQSLGIEIEAVRRAITFIVGPGKEMVIGEIGLTPRAVAATTLAINEAGHLQQEKIAPEHLLLGLTREGEGIAAGLLRAFGTTLEKVRAQTFQAIALASRGKAAEQSSPKSNVVTCRIDGHDLDAVDALIEAGIRSTRSDAAAWLIHAGVEANRPLFEKVYGTVAEIRRLRVVAQSLAQEAAGSAEVAAESTEEQTQS